MSTMHYIRLLSLVFILSACVYYVYCVIVCVCVLLL